MVYSSARRSAPCSPIGVPGKTRRKSALSFFCLFPEYTGQVSEKYDKSVSKRAHVAESAKTFKKAKRGEGCSLYPGVTLRARQKRARRSRLLVDKGYTVAHPCRAIADDTKATTVGIVVHLGNLKRAIPIDADNMGDMAEAARALHAWSKDHRCAGYWGCAGAQAIIGRVSSPHPGITQALKVLIQALLGSPPGT